MSKKQDKAQKAVEKLTDETLLPNIAIIPPKPEESNVPEFADGSICDGCSYDTCTGRGGSYCVMGPPPEGYNEENGINSVLD